MEEQPTSWCYPHAERQGGERDWSGKKWYARPRLATTGLGCRGKFKDAYEIFAHNLFFDDYDSFQAANTSMFGKEDWKQRLEDYFKIEL